jgi:hypothetical protein
MGNMISKRYQGYYLKNMFRVLKRDYEEKIKNYKVIKFNKENEVYMVTTLNPSLYNHYTDVELFKTKFSKTSAFLTNFLFVEMNKEKNDEFDFIFEFGEFFSELITDEQMLIQMLNNFLDTLISLESKNLHYPCLSSSYIIKNITGEFKLLNPLCFSNFLEDLTNIYINPQITESKKKVFSEKKLEENRFVFFQFALSLFSKTNYKLLTSSDIIKKKFFIAMQQNFSQNFVTFMQRLSENTFVSFTEIKIFLNQQNLESQLNHSFSKKRFSITNNERNSINRSNLNDSEGTKKITFEKNNFNETKKKTEINKNESIVNSSILQKNVDNLNNSPSPSNLKQQPNNVNIFDEKKLNTPKKKINYFKKESNTPIPIFYEGMNTTTKNVRSFSSYTNFDKNQTELGQKKDCLVNLEKIEKKDFHQTEKKAYETKTQARPPSCESTLKKNKFKLFENTQQEVLKAIEKDRFLMYLNDKKYKLFEHKINHNYNCFQNIKNIVDNKHPLKPSVYHNVEEFPESNLKQNSTNINKYYYKKSLQNLDNLDKKENIDHLSLYDKQKLNRRLSEKRYENRNIVINEPKRISVSRVLFNDSTNFLSSSINTINRRF